MENHSELPSDEDFRKAETMIGKFLKPSSTDLPYAIEMAGQIICRLAKDTSSGKHASHSGETIKPVLPTSKGTFQLSGTKPHPSGTSKVRTKQITRKYQDVPFPTKFLIMTTNPIGAQASQANKRKSDVKAEAP